MITKETIINAMATGSGGEFPYTCTYASATTFTISGADWTSVFKKGLKIEMTNGGEIRYGYVISSSFSVSSTTVTVTALNDASGNIESIANSAITNVYIGASNILRSHPIYINYTATLVGWSANPTNSYYRFSIIGNLVHLQVRQATAGTSNATTATISLPITAKTLTNAFWGGLGFPSTDNGAAVTTINRIDINSAGTTAAVFKDIAGVAWTAANGKRVNFTIFYEI